MSPEELFAALGVAGQQARLDALLAGLDATAPQDWRRLAAALALRLAASAGPAGGGPVMVVGIAGGQGAGKSTLARLLVRALEMLGLRAASASIDDFYLTRDERLRLARRVHPLLATRGVPGTHDVRRCLDILESLASPGEVALPVFDKGLDDRAPETAWPRLTGPLDVFVLEGWCLGAVPEPPQRLARPVNALEAEEDPAGHWRRFVNDALAGDYATLWSRVSCWLYLRVPDMNAVRRWRAEQERGLPPQRRMSADELSRFVAHYERLTRWMFETMPTRADVVATLGDDHRLAALVVRDAG